MKTPGKETAADLVDRMAEEKRRSEARRAVTKRQPRPAGLGQYRYIAERGRCGTKPVILPAMFRCT
jgi:hypothetical protein